MPCQGCMLTTLQANCAELQKLQKARLIAVSMRALYTIPAGLGKPVGAAIHHLLHSNKPPKVAPALGALRRQQAAFSEQCCGSYAAATACCCRACCALAECYQSALSVLIRHRHSEQLQQQEQTKSTEGQPPDEGRRHPSLRDTADTLRLGQQLLYSRADPQHAQLGCSAATEAKA